jgi:hypothetical protein
MDHPHAGATYEIEERAEGGFSVRVSIPGSYPTIVSGFAAEADAVAWAARHKERVDSGEPLRRSRFARR